jgi:transposase
MNKTVHYVGLDVHKETIAVAIAPAHNNEVRLYGIINGTLDALDKLIKKLQQPAIQLRFVYEAGPCGYVIYRHLKNKGLHCQVVAPSLIPKKASDRVKTDRRDAQQLARLYRAGELSAIYVPDEEDEAVRDLVRARNAAVTDQRKARQRLKGFLLRLGFRYTGKSSWTEAHQRYLARLNMPRPAQQIAFQEYLEAINVQTERLGRLTRAMENALAGWKWEPVVRALMSLRGVQVIVAMTLVAEAGDMSRFEDPRQLMSYFGLVPSEHTSSDKRRQGSITKCGNGACRRVLIEAAWQYRLPPKVSPSLRVRQEKQPKAVRDISWKAQQRLHQRYKVLSAHHKKSGLVVTALARELTGFVWAIACQLRAPDKVKKRQPLQPAAKSGRKIDREIRPSRTRSFAPLPGNVSSSAAWTIRGTAPCPSPEPSPLRDFSTSNSPHPAPSWRSKLRSGRRVNRLLASHAEPAKKHRKRA